MYDINIDNLFYLAPLLYPKQQALGDHLHEWCT